LATKVGPLAALHAEAASLIPAKSRRFNRGWGELHTVFPTNSPSSRVLLLLRFGEVEAALKNWVPDEQYMSQVQVRMKRPKTEIGKRESYDPYLELTEDWAWSLSNAKRIPLFNPFAPVEKRDQSIQNAKAWLARNE
jgi:hypothetical protein